MEKELAMEIITSKNNPAVVAAAKLSDKKYRERTKTFAFEGIKLFEEAFSAGVRFVRVFATEGAYEKYGEALSVLPSGVLSIVSDSVYEKLSFEHAPQGIFCIAEYFAVQTQEEASFVILLDGVADPGNFGAVLRSAEAFGVDAVYMSKNGADFYNPKTVRACMGSLFRTDIRRSEDIVAEIKRLQKEGFRIFATALDKRSMDIRSVDFSGKIGFVIGNEGHGVSAEAIEACDGTVIIPMCEGPESLNAAVASSVVMWEAARNRI
jgi:TrmH family RNA methyltransferase